MMIGAAMAGTYQYTRLRPSRCISSCCIVSVWGSSASIPYAWNVDERPNAVAITNRSGAEMNVRRTARTIGGDTASVKISDACMTGSALFITVWLLFVTPNPLCAVMHASEILTD